MPKIPNIVITSMPKGPRRTKTLRDSELLRRGVFTLPLQDTKGYINQRGT